MNILIVDGNDKNSSEEYTKIGMNTQYDEYEKVLKKISPAKLNIDIIHPTWDKSFLKKGINLDNFHGIVWTGSVLNIYDTQPSITRQIDLAKALLEKNNKIFGSCWGLQVLATAAGGLVRKNPKGLEAVIAKKIFLNIEGVNHHMYLNKPKEFDSFCWHYDEVVRIPDNAVVLASNENSNIQALAFTKGNSEFWGVQYHPEFNSLWISGLMSMRKNILLNKQIYKNEKEYEITHQYFSSTKKNKKLQNKLKIENSLINDSTRYTELLNWLENLKN